MRILLEGCDKTGKSSMAAALARRTGLIVRKFSQPKDRVMTEYFDATRSGESFIADRFHLGERVYAPLYRGYTVDFRQVMQLEEELIAGGALLVLMTDSVSAIVERFRALHEDFAREDDVQTIVERFQWAWETSVLAKTVVYWGATPEQNQEAVDYVTRLSGARG